MTLQYPQIGDIWFWYGNHVLFLSIEEPVTDDDLDGTQRFTGMGLESGRISGWMVTRQHLMDREWTKVA